MAFREGSGPPSLSVLLPSAFIAHLISSSKERHAHGSSLCWAIVLCNHMAIVVGE